MNEKLLGDFIKKHDCRDQLFGMFPSHPFSTSLTMRYLVASKCGVAVFEDNKITNSASHIRTYIEGSIERLGFTPDLYYLHRIDPGEYSVLAVTASRKLTPLVDTPLEESIPALDALRREGKTRYIGLSECSAATLRKAHASKFVATTCWLSYVLKRGLVAKIDAVQAEYSPFETIHESDGLLDACRELGVTFVAYGPLGHGWLVDNFPWNSPEDMKEDDYRRQSEAFLILEQRAGLTLCSPQVSGRELLCQQKDEQRLQRDRAPQGLHRDADRAGLDRFPGHDRTAGNSQSRPVCGELGLARG